MFLKIKGVPCNSVYIVLIEGKFKIYPTIIYQRTFYRGQKKHCSMLEEAFNKTTAMERLLSFYQSNSFASMRYS